MISHTAESRGLLHNGDSPNPEERLSESILRQLQRSLAPASRGEAVWIGCLLLGVLAALVAYTWQLINGLRVTAMREYVSWGVYMTNFVFFIGVSHAGTLISAILRVTGAEWRRSITRMAEAITVFALMVGAPMVIIDMGRPDRVLNVVIYGRLNSPILWDLCSICTYLFGSLLYLYVAMIPDLALLAPPAPVWERRTWRQRICGWLSLGYRGTPEQRRLLERALATMAVIIIPVAVSVHTVVSWIFGMTLRPGWHSTIFGPYFVIGAIFSGTAAIITAMALFRKVYHLENFLTVRQFQNLGRLLLALNLLYVYFTLSEYLTAWYGAEDVDQRLVDLLMGHNTYGLAFWGWAAFCLFLPALLLMLPLKQNLITRLVVASVLINIGMWVKRYLIIVPTLMTTYIPPESAGVTPHYWPTWVEWTVTLGGLSTFMLLFTLFAKVFPIISIWETVEGVTELGASQIGVEIELPPRPASRWRRFRPGLAAGALLFLGFLGANPSLLAETSSEQPRPEIALSSRLEDEERLVVAAVKLNGQPLPEVPVAFYVERVFGRLPLGTNATEADGVATAYLPDDLPSGPQGVLRVTAAISPSSVCAGSISHAALPGGKPTALPAHPFPRALWSPHAPLGLVLTIFILLSIVWSTFTFVLTQLIKLRRTASQ